MSKRLSRVLIVLVSLSVLVGMGMFWWPQRPRPPLESRFVQNINQDAKEAAAGQEEAAIEVDLIEPGNDALLANPKHVYQTFNNCGPATLSMILSWYGVDVSQAELGRKMRPFQNPQGDNDDKTIFTAEFVSWAKKYGLEAIGRVNGDIELLKKFTANGIPVVVKTWLSPGEDIGHFRLVRGFDEGRGVIVQDDSYQGPNRKITDYDFLSLWQPFNYHYIIVYPPELKEKVAAIIGRELEESIAWQNARERAEKEQNLDSANPYPAFNIATAAYYLKDYEGSVRAFEAVENDLPRRMLWYQIEPILAYQKLGDEERVFELIARIMENGNKAFSELYLIRGEIYLGRGEKDKAKEQFELALYYNENFVKAKEALLGLE